MPPCIEIKQTLENRTAKFTCDLVRLDAGAGVLRHVIDRTYTVGSITLLPGQVTWAFFWQDRPYTLYAWQLPDGWVHYFNIADSISLRPDEFRWRDLAVDILVDQAGVAQVLDEHELPQDLPAGLRRYIRDATSRVLADFRAIIEEAESLIAEKS